MQASRLPPEILTPASAANKMHCVTRPRAVPFLMPLIGSITAYCQAPKPSSHQDLPIGLEDATGNLTEARASIEKWQKLQKPISGSSHKVYLRSGHQLAGSEIQAETLPEAPYRLSHRVSLAGDTVNEDRARHRNSERRWSGQDLLHWLCS